MKRLTLLLFSVLPLLLSAQYQYNYKLQIVKGHWKYNTDESIHIPESSAGVDKKGINTISEIQIHVKNGLVDIYGKRSVGGNGKSEVVLYHCSYTEMNKIELDKYLARYNIDRDALGLRPGIVMDYKISCGSFPFKDFIRINDDTVLTVWNDQVCYFHRK